MPKRRASGTSRGDRGIAGWLIGQGIAVLLSLAHLLPYRRRLAFGGWVMSRVVAPIAGYRRRINDNLALVAPDLPASEVARLTRDVPERIGRTVVELFSPDDLTQVAADTPMEGPGLEALEAARAAGRPSIVVSGHFGNYDIGRAGLIARGFRVGGLYREMNNARFNEIYVETISKVGTPLFRRDRRGMGEMLRFLKDGGTLAILIDQHMGGGEPLEFFGNTAYTALSAAELALKYDAVIVPLYAIRQPDGISFRTLVEAPIPHTTAAEMTQALNDSLEARVRANMDQWLWIHRRWKPAKTR